jgi:hypothetical protein
MESDPSTGGDVNEGQPDRVVIELPVEETGGMPSIGAGVKQWW